MARIRSKKVLAKIQKQKDDRVNALQFLKDTANITIPVEKRATRPKPRVDPYTERGVSRKEALKVLIRENNPKYIMVRYAPRLLVGRPDPYALYMRNGEVTPVYLKDMTVWSEQLIIHDLENATWVVKEVREVQDNLNLTTATAVENLDRMGGYISKVRYVLNTKFTYMIAKRNSKGEVEK